MKERSYTVAEIDQMREAVEHQRLFGRKISERKFGAPQISGCYMPEEKTKCVEEMLRTYMLAGIEPEELE